MYPSVKEINMKPHQRRQEAAYPYYKIATWDARLCTFRDGKVAFASETDALQSVRGPGRYRVSTVTADGRKDAQAFDVGEMVGGD